MTSARLNCGRSLVTGDCRFDLPGPLPLSVTSYAMQSGKRGNIQLIGDMVHLC